MSFPYEELLNLPHPMSKNHPPMPLADRAAQFAPFAALTGFDDQIAEAARLTDHQLDMDEYEKAALNDKLRRLQAQLPEQPMVTVTFFVPDDRKAGGRYVTKTGWVKKLEEIEGVMVLGDGTRIPFERIAMIET